MQKHPELTLQRLQLFGSQSGLAGLLYTERAPVELAVFHAPGRISYEEAVQGAYQPTRVGSQFGPFWSTHWFRVGIEIPAGWTGREVHFLWDSTSEAEVWIDGRPMQGLTGSVTLTDAGPIRKEYILTNAAQGGERLELYIEMAANNLFGLGSAADPVRLAQVGMLTQAEIATFDREAWDLLWDFKVIADLAKELGPNTPRGGQAMHTGNAMVNCFQANDRATWAAARALAANFLGARNGGGQMNLSAVGHAHIDTAWLWPLAETRRKCIRTFSTAVTNMNEYPNYRFAASQAQQYEWVKEMHPGLYAQIKEKVESGQFIPAGGSWVEPDCNLPSGESLVRQFLYGQRFFRREFGVTCEEFWEPDVFGYSAALPQILRQVGMRYFITIKLSWNQFNKLSSHTFWWEGLDGSRVLTHFPPADTYNSVANVKEVLYSLRNYKDHDRSREAYLLFGYGDGGGGPTREMIEQLSRMQDVDGLPRVEMRTPNEFFHRLEDDANELLTWSGELYFELHRGTYTTQARNKRYNRLSEILLHDTELVAALASLEASAEYPHAEIDRLWKLVLTSQFHDIIPGSSIAEVYQDSNEHYQEVLGTATGLRNQAMSALMGAPAQEGPAACIFNTLGFDRREVVALPAGLPAAQETPGGERLGVVSVPSLGYTITAAPEETDEAVQLDENGDFITLENAFVRASLTRGGQLVSLFDKRASREVIEAGQSGNRFVLFDDQPNNWEAWDVDIFHLEKPFVLPGAIQAAVVERGPLRASVEFAWEISPNSRIRQVVSLTAISPRLDFATEVEWHERRQFLKVEFPLNLRAAQATYEIQFGNLQRPTHFNTSWDMARFEVVAHKWADVSEPDFGVALLNDCKYGHAVHGNVMRLSLLRAPTSPDPEADQGTHIFRYALLPHAGSPQMNGVIEEGYRFNMPVLVFPTGAEPQQRAFLQIDHPAVIIETVKKAEDSPDLIVRMYEARGTHASARLSSSLPVQSAVICNLLEDDLEDGSTVWQHDGAALTFRPFEIKTLKLRL